jgi:hexosaminidase
MSKMIYSEGRVKANISWILLATALSVSIPPLLPTAAAQKIPQAQADLPVMPLPMHSTPGNGQFLLDDGLDIVFTGHTEPRLKRARQRFFDTLQSSTGLRRWPNSPATIPQFLIDTKAASLPIQQLGEDESYRLEVTPTKVTLTAPNPLGVLRGLQTFLQLVHPTPQGFAVSSTLIEDQPRFPWRGLMIDTGRHFIPLSVMRQNLDAMEAVKLNVLHWHLSEDQGFRVESKLFPKLQQMGSDGQYYTQDEVRGLIDYARDRGIRVMPEFEMPSHVGSWFVGYPKLADADGPFRIKYKLGQSWDRKRIAAEDSSMDPTLESTYAFLDKFLKEMSALFPDAYLHVGGDAEDAIKEWATNPKMQQYIHAHNLKDSAALQTYFTSRLQTLVARHHKTMVGWDEVLQPDTPKDVVIQSWRGLDSLAIAVARGNRGILSWGYYLDLNEPASRHYAVDPLLGAVSKLTAAQQSSVLGGEAAMWSEYVTPETIDGRIWPRAATVAERLWSPQTATDADSMYLRLAGLSQYLAYRGLPYAATRELTLQRMVGTSDATSLKVLASVVEPPTGYPRGGQREFDAYTPLNHLADIIPAESARARDFKAIANRIAAGTATPADHRLAREWLTLWRNNDAALQPILLQSSLTAELVPVSHNLSRTAQIGLEALDSIETHSPMLNSIQKERLASLKSLNTPTEELTHATIPGVEVLIGAAGH